MDKIESTLQQLIKLQKNKKNKLKTKRVYQIINQPPDQHNSDAKTKVKKEIQEKYGYPGIIM